MQIELEFLNGKINLKKVTHSWTKEIFFIKKNYNTKHFTYKLHDLNGEEILGRFYARELHKNSGQVLPSELGSGIYLDSYRGQGITKYLKNICKDDGRNPLSSA